MTRLPALILLFCAWGCLGPGFISAALAQQEDTQEIFPQSLLVLGPLPAAPDTEEAPFPRGQHLLVPEIQPGEDLPDSRELVSLVPGQELSWQEVSCGPDGKVDFPEKDHFWLSAN